MTFQRIRRRGVHSQGLRRGGGESGTNALTQLDIILRDEPELRFKIPHKGIIENQKKSMPRETEKHLLIHLMIDGKQMVGELKKTEGSLRIFSQDGHAVMIFFAFSTRGFAPTS